MESSVHVIRTSELEALTGQLNSLLCEDVSLKDRLPVAPDQVGWFQHRAGDVVFDLAPGCLIECAFQFMFATLHACPQHPHTFTISNHLDFDIAYIHRICIASFPPCIDE